MQLYRVWFDADPTVVFLRTKNDAKKVAKANYDNDPTIDLVRVKTDIGSICNYLNGMVPQDFEVLATWTMTPRGGLRDVKTLQRWTPTGEALM